MTIHYTHQHPLFIMLSPPNAACQESPELGRQKQNRAHRAEFLPRAWMNAPLFPDALTTTSLLVTQDTEQLHPPTG